MGLQFDFRFADDGLCGDGWKGYGSNCYIFSYLTQTIEYASQTCSFKGGHLVDIHSQAENEFVRSLVPSDYTEIFLGYLRKSSAPDGFVWEITGQAGTYTNWKPGQPDYEYGMDNCTAMDTRPGEGGWSDVRCWWLTATVCKKG